MDTNAVMYALSRFVDMRGLPYNILSDNWKTFVSDDKELESWVRNLDESMIISRTKANLN